MANHLNYAHFCDIANISENNKVNIIGIFKNIFAETLPALNASMCLIFEAHLDKGNWDIIVQDDEGKTIAEDKNKKIDEANGQEIGEIISFQNTVFTEYKTKKFTIIVSGEVLGSVEINVTKPSNA